MNKQKIEEIKEIRKEFYYFTKDMINNAQLFEYGILKSTNRERISNLYLTEIFQEGIYKCDLVIDILRTRINRKKNYEKFLQDMIADYESIVGFMDSEKLQEVIKETNVTDLNDYLRHYQKVLLYAIEAITGKPFVLYKY